MICDEYKIFKKPKISYILEKTLVLFITFSNCKNQDERTLKKEESIQILKIHVLIQNK